jgi:cytochrome c6
MRSKLAWGVCALLSVVAIAIAVPAVAANEKESSAKAPNTPGNVARGHAVFVEFCGKCHTLAAAGSRGTLGSNLDHLQVTFNCALSAIENGVGGIQAEYVLRNVTFSEVYDVAKYVSVVSKKIGNTRCEPEDRSA